MRFFRTFQLTGIVLLLGVGLSACSGPRGVTGEAAVAKGESFPDSLSGSPEYSRTVELSPDQGLLSTLPGIKREFRGAWVATVDNIDWPSAPGLTTAQQQAEMRALLDRAVELNLNAIVFQARPTADALYASDIEPWSAYLTGKQGVAPSPYYDPLRFIIEEAHDRGLELHVWINPFRAYHPTAEETFDPLHVSFQNLTVPYGTQRWMDPGNPDAVAHTLRVIRDIVRRYDMDGIHMDDYFYPYPEPGQGGDAEPFPDDASWSAYLSSGGRLQKPDWRRQNIDRFVERVYEEVKSLKPWVKFGISPFGIWRPGNPEGITGFDAYNGIYADSRKWLVEGWVDYLSPQLYWAMDSEGQSYSKLLAWWIEQNTSGRHIWPGNFTSRIILDGSRFWDAPELIRQIRYTQNTTGADGNIHFSMRALMPAEHRMGDRLHVEAYKEPAVIPESPWLGGSAPRPPAVRVAESDGHLEAVFSSAADSAAGSSAGSAASSEVDSEAVVWVVRTLVDGRWITGIVSGTRSRTILPTGYGNRMPEAIAVSGIGRTGLEGRAVAFRLPGSNSRRRGW